MPGTAAYPAGGTAGNYPGERFGVPATGPGSAAGFGRRLAALTVDWLLGYLIAGLFAGPDALALAELLVDGAGRLVRAHGRAPWRRSASRRAWPCWVSGWRRCGRTSSVCRGRCCARRCSRWCCRRWSATPTAGAGTTAQRHDRRPHPGLTRAPAVRRDRAGQRRRTVRCTLRIFAPAGQRALGQGGRPRAERGEPGLERVHLARGDVARQLHDSGAAACPAGPGPRRCRRRCRRSGSCPPPGRGASSPAPAGP